MAKPPAFDTYKSPIDGQIVGLERTPLSVSVMHAIRILYRTRGWKPTKIGTYQSYAVCTDCARACAVRAHASHVCGFCGGTMKTGVGRLVSFSSWWAPWTWNRTQFIDWKVDDRAEDEIIDRPVDPDAPTTGRLTLVNTERKDA